MLEPEIDRIHTRLDAQFVHEALICKGILDALWGAQGPSEEWRFDNVGEHAFPGDGSAPSANAIDASGKIRRHGIGVVVESATRRSRGLRLQWLGLISK